MRSHWWGEKEGRSILGRRNRKYTGLVARGSRASKGNWKKARWLVLWQSVMNDSCMDSASSRLELLKPAPMCQFHTCVFLTWHSATLFVAGNWPTWVYLHHKNWPIPSSRASSSALHWIELRGPKSIFRIHSFQMVWIWDLKQRRDLSWEREAMSITLYAVRAN